MPDTNISKEKKEKISFFEQISFISDKLRNKYNLNEDLNEKIKKIKQGKLLNGTEITEVAIEAAQNNISREKITSILEKKLNISSGEIKKLAEDLRKEVSTLDKKTPLQKEKRTEKINAKNPTPAKDDYREIIK